MNAKLPLFVLSILVGALGCGSSADSGAPAPSTNNNGGNGGGDDGGASSADGAASAGDDGGVEAAGPTDHGTPSTTYPAFTPSFGQLENQGGYTMTSPIIVPITWSSDPTQASFDGFADTIGGTAYWKAASSEYGVGAATSGTTNHIHLATTAPATITDADIQGMVTSNAGVTAGWPAPTKDTIYAFFLPPGMSLQTQDLSGNTVDACAAGEGGYHDQVDVGTTTTAYAVVPSCTFKGESYTAAQQSTMSMSHELLEASTDPQPNAQPGYLGFSADYFSFDYFQELQAENGDACEFFHATSFFEDVETTPASFDAWVQRTWSNASAAAGHDPCVPAPSGTYFNVTPLGETAVTVTIPAQVTGLLPGLSPNTKGYKAGDGKTVTFAVGFYSDGPTSGPWSISASAGNPLLAANSIIDQYNPSSLTVTLDKTSGQNGEKAWVTVDVGSTGTLFNGEIVTITSTLGAEKHYMPVWIAGD